MRASDPKLADAIGELAMASEAFDNARPLTARMRVENARDALQEFVQEREGGDADE